MKVKKLLITGTVVVLASILVGGSILAATGEIKLVVNGHEVPTDVAPKIENGRVLVPISTVSKSLGADVQWDAKANSVMINSKQNIWSNGVSELNTSWAKMRDQITTYISYYDSKELGYKDLVTSKFDSDFVDKTKIISSKDDKILDYKFVDVGFNGVPDDPLQYIVRVEVVQFTDLQASSYDLVKRKLDFHMHDESETGNYKIEGIWSKGEEKLTSYEVFPGLTFSK